MLSIGNRVCSLLESADKDVLIVAPFMRSAALNALLDRCPTHVPVTCVGRLSALDIAQGVSDLAVFDVARDRGNCALFIRADLHAKLYRVDDRALIGSPNVTRRAFGWSDTPNLELLINVEADVPEIVQFEAQLFEGAVRATERHRSCLESAVKALLDSDWQPPTARDFPIEAVTEVVDEYQRHRPNRRLVDWSPQCWVPAQLYEAYVGNRQRMTATNFADATYDLTVLSVPSGLDPSGLGAVIRNALLQLAIVQRIEDFISVRPRRNEEIVQWLLAQPNLEVSQEEAIETWSVLKRWILHFFPDQFRTTLTEEGETFQVGRVISEW